MIKRIICVLLTALLLVSCTPLEESQSSGEVEKQEYIKGVWLSYSELDSFVASGDFASQFKNAVSECKSRGISDMFVHVRPFCDAYYPSELFPLRQGVEAVGFDILEFMVNECKKEQIRLHAWVNPYRVRTADSDFEALPHSSKVYGWLSDSDIENDSAVSVFNGIYLNPAHTLARQIVIDGIRELCLNYDIDGIHFDDYFYPTTDSAFDELSYQQYTQGASSPLSLDDWRRANVSALISGVYTAVKFINKDIVFSVSPSADTHKNYSEHYADIKLWCESGCVDMVIPQLYFGFEYPDQSYRFEKLLDEWSQLTAESSTRLLIGLASYKIGTAQQPDCAEWENGSAVINRQIEACRENEQVKGHIFFSYTSMCEYL